MPLRHSGRDHFIFLSKVLCQGVAWGVADDTRVISTRKMVPKINCRRVRSITIRKFWYTELKFTTERAIDKDWNKSGESLGLNFYARNRSLPMMTFYGLGPNTNLSNSVKFGQRDTSAGIELVSPFP